MGGGLLQLVAYGAQDVYLTGNPQITFWKVSYRRYTNFSMELIEQSISGSSTLTGNQTKGTVTISRNGDLVSQVYVYSATAGITIGSQIIQDVEIDIGGQRIDKHFNEWMLLWNELTTPASKAAGLKSLIGDFGSSGTTGVSTVIIPLSFWFCRNPGLALPLIALQYHEVKLLFTFGTTTQVGGAAAVIQVFCNYVFLDTDERRRMAQNPHEYLIDQVQTQTGSTSQSLQLNFNHPVKELIFTDSVTSAFTGAARCNLKLNGQDRFSQQAPEYFQLLQPLEYHTAVPYMNLPSVSRRSNGSLINSTASGNTFTSMAFANTAVGTTKVMVGTTTAPLTAASTVAVTTATAVTASTVVYSFLAADFVGSIPAVGDTMEFRVSLAEAASSGAIIRATVTAIVNGALAGGLTNAANFHIQLDNLLTLSTLDAVIATNFAVTNVILYKAGSFTSNSLTNTINVYSFSIRPEEHQPSGTCNFSRIDSATLNFTTSVAIANVYAVNYNVLRIMSGMGGLAYSN